MGSEIEADMLQASQATSQRTNPPSSLRTCTHRVIVWRVREANYWRGLVPPGLGWACLGLVVLVARPGRLTLLLAGPAGWWRISAFATISLLFGFGVAALRTWHTSRTDRAFAWPAIIAGWAWCLFAGGGGFGLLLIRGPWPPTNGWFALLSGLAACPLIGRLLRNSARLKVSGGQQFGAALLLIALGRIALAVWPQPNPL
jgi:hypothetical protein